MQTNRSFRQKWRKQLSRHGEFFSSLLVSLKSKNFRLYFYGVCVSLIGTWMQQIAMSWLTYKMTGSVFLLAVVTFMAQIPILVATPFLSIFVDRFDRRKILILTQSLSGLQALLLAGLVLSGTIQVAHLLILSLFIGLINALDNPTRQTFYPSLVAREHLSNAIALNSAVINGSRLIGPAVGGVLIGMFGEGICFLLNGISFLAVIIALCRMRLPRPTYTNANASLFKDLYEGFHYMRGNVPIRSLLLLMSLISFFGLPLITFIPAYVKDILGGNSEMLGGLLSSIGIGSFIAAIYLAARKSITGLSGIIALSSVLLGITLISLSFIHTPLLAILACVPAGFTLIITVASINTLLQTLSEEDKRGRVMGYMAMTFTGVSPIGSMILGFAEKYTGLPAIIFLSGTACFFTGCIFEYWRPQLYRQALPILIEKGFIKENQNAPSPPSL